MTYDEARNFIAYTNQYGSILGLTTITELLRRLDNPQDKLRIIHIAGTNGKGSVGAFLTSILSTAGYKAGRYVSPTVFSYRERIQISEASEESHVSDESQIINEFHVSEESQIFNNSQAWPYDEKVYDKPVANDSIKSYYITREGVQATIEKIKPICETMVLDGFSHPTSFEIETAMTFLYLLWEEVDFVILEAGMGGRLDATNVIKRSECAVFTSISMDHMQYLGDTIEKIATEKSGIIKSCSSVVTIEQKQSILNILKEKAKEMNSTFADADTANVDNIRYSLEQTAFSYPKGPNAEDYLICILGKHQVKNAILAIEVAHSLSRNGHHISKQDIFLGLYRTRWSGRLEILDTNPYLLIDGAHNEEAALYLRDSIEIYFTNRKFIFMIGVLKDKDYKNILSILAPMADTIITITPDNVRALSSEILAREASAYCDRVIDGRNVDQSLKLAYEMSNKEDVIIAFGSLSFLKDVINAHELRKDNN